MFFFFLHEDNAHLKRIIVIVIGGNRKMAQMPETKKRKYRKGLTTMGLRGTKKQNTMKQKGTAERKQTKKNGQCRKQRKDKKKIGYTHPNNGRCPWKKEKGVHTPEQRAVSLKTIYVYIYIDVYVYIYVYMYVLLPYLILSSYRLVSSIIL